MKLATIIAIATLAVLAASPAVAECDRQAMEAARSLWLLGDREALRLHLRSYCPEMPVPPGLLYGAESRHDDVERARPTPGPADAALSRKAFDEIVAHGAVRWR